MKNVVKCLQLGFIPSSADLGLLVLRLWLGGSMFYLHGLSKLTGFREMSKHFPDLLGIGSRGSLSLATFAEAICSLLLAAGLFTRFAALSLTINMSVAFFMAHKAVLKGQGSGELAYIYLAGFVTLLIAGGGRFSADANLGGKSSSRPSSGKGG